MFFSSFYRQTPISVLSAIRIFDLRTTFSTYYSQYVPKFQYTRTSQNVLYFILRTLLNVRTSLNNLYFILRTLLSVLCQ
jgi:hypothetical protein